MPTKRSGFVAHFAPFILALLPALVVIWGWTNIQQGELARTDSEQGAEARMVLESMEKGWSFQQQMTRVGSEFRRELLRTFHSFPSSRLLNDLIKHHSNRFFAPPFPEHELFVFTWTGTGTAAAPDLVFSRQTGALSRRTMVLSFQHLVRNFRKTPESTAEGKLGQKFIRTLFGEAVPSDILAGSQIGAPTPVIYKNHQHWFLWDFVEKDGKPLGGFFLLVPDSLDAVYRGMATALNMEPRATPKGFIRFHRSEVGDVLNPPMKSAPGLRSWITIFRRQTSLRALERRTIASMSVGLPSHTLYYRPIPNSTHIAACLFPRPAARPFPALPGIFLGAGLSGLFLIFLRSWLLGGQARIPLNIRFAGFYFMVFAFPLSLGLVFAFDYAKERESSLMKNLEQEVQTDLLSVDLGKDRMQNEYRGAFHRVIQNPDFLEALKSQGLKNSEHPDLLPLATGEFLENQPPLPFSILSLLDPNGRQLVAYTRASSSFMQNQIASYVFSKDFDSSLKRNAGEGSLSAFEGLYRFHRSALISALRSRLKGHESEKRLGPDPLETGEKIFLEVYENATGININELFEEFRDFGLIIQTGNEYSTKIHDFLNIGGLDRFAMFVLWRNDYLDQLIFRQVLEKFTHKYREVDGLFNVFQTVRGSREPILENTRHHQRFLNPAAEKAGNLSGFNVIHDPKQGRLTMILPSPKTAGYLYAAGVGTDSILSTVRRELWEFAFLFLVSSCIAAILLTWTSHQVVTPINRMKEALEKVRKGDLEQSLAMDRADEFGVLGKTFDTMIEGLRTRQKLSTLVSHKALEAMAGNEALEKISRGYRTTAVTMVSDIRSFTTMCENQPVKVITDLLNRHFEEMAEIITRQGGKIDKFIGDAIQAVFEEDPGGTALPASERAIRAGFAMLEALSRINEERKARNLFPYFIGVGLARGEILSGAVGDLRHRFEYSVMGAPMKEAAHLEALSKLAPHLPLVVSPQIVREAGTAGEAFSPLPGHEAEACIIPKSP